MRPFLALSLFASMLAMLASPLAAKTPEPSIYPVAWQLDFKHGSPKRVVVGTTGYWYMTYTVTNSSGAEQIFRPDFQLLTSDGKVMKSDHDIPPAVFDKIKAIEGNKLLLPLSEVAGNLRQGPEQAKDGVAIWAETTPRMASFKVFVGGLSGEYVILKEDDGKPVMGPDNIPVMLRKTVEIDYQIYGDEFYPGRDDVHELSQKWVMR
jgi:hypothetical protein